MGPSRRARRPSRLRARPTSSTTRFVGELKHGRFAACFARFERDDLARRTERADCFEAFCARARRGAGAIRALRGAFGRACPERPRLRLARLARRAAIARSGEAAFGFVRANATHVLFHKWLQWIADDQLADAQRRARRPGMRIGLYLDLAVGVAPDGADTWAAPETVVSGARIGARPTPSTRSGQDWGLVPALAHSACASAMARRCGDAARLMRHAGAIRIDHVMGLVRFYWVPGGFAATRRRLRQLPGRSPHAAAGVGVTTSTRRW